MIAFRTEDERDASDAEDIALRRAELICLFKR